MKRIFLISLALLLVLTLTAVSADDNLTAGLDDESTVFETSHSFSQIQDEIDEADENSTVALAGTYMGSGRHIVINKSITIEGTGNGTVLDAGSNSSILNITSGNVTVKNLIFKNGKSVFSGGAIHTISQLTIINCTFENNTVDTITDSNLSPREIYSQQVSGKINDVAYGGAVYCECDLAVTDSRFIENDAISIAYRRQMDYYYGVISSEGASIYSKGNLILNRSFFSKLNWQQNEIVCNNLTADGCEFSGITASPRGSVLINNSIFGQDSSLSLYGSLNESCVISNSVFKDVNSNALRVNAGVVLFENNTFSDNHPDYSGVISISAPCVEISGNDFSRNSARFYSMLSITGGENLSLSNNTFADNLISGDNILYAESSVLYLEGCNASVVGCNFTNNSAPTAGAICCRDVELSVENCSFKNNAHVTFDFKDVNLKIDENSQFYDSRILLNESLGVVPNELVIGLSKSYTFSYPSKNVKIKIPAKLSYNDGIDIGLHFHVTTNAVESYHIEHGYYDSYDDFYFQQMRDSKNGYVTFYLGDLPVGTYVIKVENLDYDIELTSKLKITKAKTTVKAPKLTAKYKKSKTFKITVKSNKKAVKNLKIKVKVYTGKKYKTYNLKTNKNGIATLNTKNLKKGNHKVIISSANKNYSLSAKSNIKIK